LRLRKRWEGWWRKVGMLGRRWRWERDRRGRWLVVGCREFVGRAVVGILVAGRVAVRKDCTAVVGTPVGMVVVGRGMIAGMIVGMVVDTVAAGTAAGVALLCGRSVSTR
jgi:hypothetical protein